MTDTETTTDVAAVPPARAISTAQQALAGPSDGLDDLRRCWRIGQWLAASELERAPMEAEISTAALRVYYAQALGLPPMAAADLAVIHGKLFVGAKLMRAMAAERGYHVRRTPDSDGETCTAELFDDEGRRLGSSTFTLAQAKAAGLVRARSAWETFPDRMLWARAAKYLLDDYAPGLMHGLFVLGVDDDRPQDAAPASADFDYSGQELPDVQDPETDEDIPF